MSTVVTVHKIGNGPLDAALVEFAEDGLGGDLLVEDEHGRVGAAGLYYIPRS